MTRKSVRMEFELKQAIDDISADIGETITDGGFNIAQRGVEVAESGQPVIEGPFGMERPFSKLSFSGGNAAEARIRVTDELLEDAREQFGNRTDTENLREALRLGVAVMGERDIKIEGAGGVIRPFAVVNDDLKENG